MALNDPFAPDKTVILDADLDAYLHEEFELSGPTGPARPRAPSVLYSDPPKHPPPLPHDRLLRIRQVFDAWRSSGFPLTHAYDAMRAIGRLLK